jgi:hypothetical protein
MRENPPHTCSPPPFCRRYDANIGRKDSLRKVLARVTKFACVTTNLTDDCPYFIATVHALSKGQAAGIELGLGSPPPLYRIHYFTSDGEERRRSAKREAKHKVSAKQETPLLPGGERRRRGGGQKQRRASPLPPAPPHLRGETRTGLDREWKIGPIPLATHHCATSRPLCRGDSHRVALTRPSGRVALARPGAN